MPAAVLIFRHFKIRAATVALAVLVAPMGVSSIPCNSIWRNDTTMFLETISISPDAGGMYIGLGMLFGQEGNLRKARQAFERGPGAHILRDTFRRKLSYDAQQECVRIRGSS
ncbi:MAG: hypothetical protein H6Q05_1058 [Acidobacteria bacterium]|nr:hypothetical protein [Acidobacteriota bacterium]